MATFETRPRRVQAVRFTGKGPLPEGVGYGRNPGQEPHFFVTTAHGQQATVVPGDWIVPEPDGRGHYPVKDDIFRSRHDPVCTCGLTPVVRRESHDPDCAFAQLA